MKLCARYENQKRYDIVNQLINSFFKKCEPKHGY